jgi:hypothetical protein
MQAKKINTALGRFLHLFIVVSLTVLTQVGGALYLASILLVKNRRQWNRIKQIGMFTVLYLLTTFVIVPNLAPIFGREKISDTEFLKARSLFYKVTNRNYVQPVLNKILGQIASDLDVVHPGIRMEYLDANFPFVNGFPLLPHLSHNDGKKIDVSFIYENTNGQLTNKKPSRSGYGYFVLPTVNEVNQTEHCKEDGYWQYDYSKYLTFGSINKDIVFSEVGTQTLAQLILKQNDIGKLFIEPHLKARLKLNNEKVRFHGCRAVRHDDHIHFQLK